MSRTNNQCQYCGTRGLHPNGSTHSCAEYFLNYQPHRNEEPKLDEAVKIAGALRAVAKVLDPTPVFVPGETLELRNARAQAAEAERRLEIERKAHRETADKLLARAHAAERGFEALRESSNRNHPALDLNRCHIDGPGVPWSLAGGWRLDRLAITDCRIDTNSEGTLEITPLESYDKRLADARRESANRLALNEAWQRRANRVLALLADMAVSTCSSHPRSINLALQAMMVLRGEAGD